MTPSIFARRDLTKLIQAMGSNERLTQSDIGVLWSEFVGDVGEMPDGNKVHRATQLVSRVAKRHDADDKLTELINEAFYFSPKGDSRRQDATFKPLLVRLYEKNFTVDDDGVHQPLLAAGNTLSTTKDSRSIFVVHGRNLAARDELIKFLKHLDARPISWTQAANAVDSPLEYTRDIIEAGMNMAQAIVVLFSPDDEARLKEQFIEPQDGPHERDVTGQARQNVTLEAGMALGMAPDRTIFVRIGRTREISDIAGINWISLQDDWDSRERLANALKKAGVAVQMGNLTDPNAGTFDGISV